MGSRSALGPFAVWWRYARLGEPPCDRPGVGRDRRRGRRDTGVLGVRAAGGARAGAGPVRRGGHGHGRVQSGHAGPAVADPAVHGTAIAAVATVARWAVAVG